MLNIMSVGNVITVIGIPAIVGALIYIGRKLEILDTLKLKLDAVEKKVDGIFERFIKVEERVNTLWKDDIAPSHSPRQLNDREWPF